MTKEQLVMGTKIYTEIDAIESFIGKIERSDFKATQRQEAIDIPNEFWSDYTEAMNAYQKDYLEKLAQKVKDLESQFAKI